MIFANNTEADFGNTISMDIISKAPEIRFDGRRDKFYCIYMTGKRVAKSMRRSFIVTRVSFVTKGMFYRHSILSQLYVSYSWYENYMEKASEMGMASNDHW